MSVSFDEPNLVPSAGLLPAAVLAQRVGLAGLLDGRLTLQRHGTNIGTKALTVIGSMLSGGDSIDDTDLLRAGATGTLFDTARAPSTIGSWSVLGVPLRSGVAVILGNLREWRAAGPSRVRR